MAVLCPKTSQAGTHFPRTNNSDVHITILSEMPVGHCAVVHRGCSVVDKTFILGVLLASAPALAAAHFLTGRV